MRIYEMTATFGKLDNETLCLQPGMNVILAPNEWGKSTWCAFLTAMLYGIDTRERTTKDSLSDKEHYSPWSGKPMEGRIRLEYQGRDITIARRTRGRVPLGEFCAFETATGLPVRELTADNCGQVLLGVERSVFRRSGFVTLRDMPVTQDEALRRRLNALVTTADESGAADYLAEKLKELKNKCHYHRTGLIPQCREQLEQVKSQLQQRQSLDESLAEAIAGEKELEQQREALQLHRQWLDYRETQKNAQRLNQALEADGEARQKVEQCKALCEKHLSRQELEARLVVQEEERRPRTGWWLIWLAVLALAAAGALVYFGEMAYALAAAVPAPVLLVLGILIQRRYGRWERQRDIKFRQREHWLSQLRDWDELEQCRRAAEQARSHVKTLRSLIRSVPRPDWGDMLELDENETEETLRELDQKIQRQRQLKGQILGRMEGIPGEQVLTEQLEGIRLRLAELERTYLALGYAQKALEEATQTLQKRFAPRILRRAEGFLSRLTRGRYTQLQLSQDLTLTAVAADEAMGRGSLWRSEGTADQMYLALRLAVWEALMPTGPLVLDDALVRFDRHRLDAAMNLLEELSQEHQIIVFTCR